MSNTKTLEMPKNRVFINNTLSQFSWERSPCWRWTACQKYLALFYNSLHDLVADEYLYKGALYYRAKYAKNKESSFQLSPSNTGFREIDTAHKIYFSSGIGQLRWYLEAILMSPVTDAEVATEINLQGIDPGVIKAYRKLFFDVSDYLDSDIGVACTILARSKESATIENPCDYVWKMFSYNEGAIALSEMVSGRRDKSGSSIPIGTFDSFKKDLISDAFTTSAIQYSANARTLFSEGSREVLGIIKNFWDVAAPSNKLGNGETSEENTFVKELQEKIHHNVMTGTIRKEVSNVAKRKRYQYN